MSICKLLIAGLLTSGCDCRLSDTDRQNAFVFDEKWTFPKNLNLDTSEFPGIPYVYISIRDAECYSSNTESSFEVLLCAMDYENTFLSATRIHSGRFRKEYGQHIFSDYLTSEYTRIRSGTIDECFEKGHIDCVPRADVLFIRFESEPPDPWAIDQIDVDVTFQLGIVERHWYTWHFEHAVLLPCMSWMKGKHVYQIGPRNGLFIEHGYRFTPKFNERIRDWV